MLKRFVAIVSTLLIAGMLAGCAANFAPGDVAPAQTPIGEIQGSVHGGNFPVIGAQIYLFAAGQGGYGTSATSLITSGKTGVSCSSPVVSNACYVTTDGNGSFTVGGDYTCTAGTQVYMVAVAGNPGLTGSTTTATFATNSSTITVASVTGISIGSTASGTGVSGTVTAVSGTTVTLSNKTTAAGTNVSVTFSVYNTGAVQMAALGHCPASGTMATQVPYLVINEVTTVAFAYSVGGFATTAYNVSSDASGETALATAFANANNIVTLGNGQANATISGNANSVAPQGKINSLANILATCVNTRPASPTQSSTQCTQLFAAATTSTGTKATDEANAMFNIAHNQAQNVATIWNLGGSTGPFGPVSSQPADWTMPVIYKNVISKPGTTSPIISGPYNMAFDAAGNAWIGDRVNGVVKIGAQGAVSTFSTGFKMVKGVAVSPQDGTIWVSDYGNNDVVVMDSTGTKLGTITLHLTGNGPVLTAFALNPAGGNYLAHEVTETTTGLTTYDSGTYAALHFANNTVYPNVSDPGWIAADNTGAVWFPSTNSSYIGGLAITDNNGTVKYVASEPNVGATYQTVAEAEGAAADGAGNVWAPSGTTLYQVNAGVVYGAYSGGGMTNPSKTFVDGSNVVWVASSGANIVSAFYTTGTAAGNPLATGGFSTDAPSLTGCSVIGVDPSGNVWSGNADQSVTELLGLGAPTAAPLYGGSTVVTGTGRLAVTTVTKGNLGIEP